MVVDGKTIKLKRVVITGFGLVTPLGCGSDSVCNRLFDNQCGIKRIKPLSFNDNISSSSSSSSSLLSSCSINAVAFVPLHHDHPWNIEIKEKSTSSSSLSSLSSIGKSKNLSKFIEYAILASEIALDHANIKNNNLSSYYNLNRCGVAIGNGGIGSLHEIIKANNSLELSYKKLSPYFIPKILNNMASGQVSIKYGLKGPVHSVSTACAAGAHSIGDAYNFIRLGYADMMLAGGTEASIDELSIAGFARMRALGVLPTTDNDNDNVYYNNNNKNNNICINDTDTDIYGTGDINNNNNNADNDNNNADNDNDNRSIQRTSCPFHEDRNGFVIGEGCGILVLEELSLALARNACIIAEVCGYGLSGDAYNATMPSIDGDGASRSMVSAMNDAGIDPSQVSYINAHATSTPIGDLVEINAIKKVFDRRTPSSSSQQQPSSSSSSSPSLYVSSTKGATGHLLGAAGAVETIFTAWSVYTGIIPATLHLTKIDPKLEGGNVFSHVPLKSIDYHKHHNHDHDHDKHHQYSHHDHENNLQMKEINKDHIDHVIDNIDICSKRYLYAITNSFGFGGTNASLVIGKYCYSPPSLVPFPYHKDDNSNTNTDDVVS